ncbi:MAG: PIN domain-containing protein, partial [Clostridiales bacterium]|nr:PIN domain-containing protein [Clostridiales bacterium]
MKILIDTNIIIENLTRRSGYIESLKILNLCENGTVSGIITTVTVMDVMYILRKHLNRDETRQAMQKLMLIVDVVSVLKS